MRPILQEQGAGKEWDRVETKKNENRSEELIMETGRTKPRKERKGDGRRGGPKRIAQEKSERKKRGDEEREDYSRKGGNNGQIDATRGKKKKKLGGAVRGTNRLWRTVEWTGKKKTFRTPRVHVSKLGDAMAIGTETDRPRGPSTHDEIPGKRGGMAREKDSEDDLD